MRSLATRPSILQRNATAGSFRLRVRNQLVAQQTSPPDAPRHRRSRRRTRRTTLMLELLKHRGCRRHVFLDRPLFDGECARDLAVAVSTALRDKHLAGSPASCTKPVDYPIELLLGGERGQRQLFLSLTTIISFGSFASSTVTVTGRDAASVDPGFFFPFSSLSSLSSCSCAQPRSGSAV